MESSFPQPPGFERPSKAEKMRYIQESWDHISDPSGELPVPQSHIELLEQRKANDSQAPSDVRSAYDVLERLTKKNR